jgi:type I restriction-modification system DNA methylase subunit
MPLTKQQAKENLAKLVEKYQEVVAQGRINEYKEEATKTAFIQPLLNDVLGWDVNNFNEVSPEEQISRGRVDYCLKIDGKPKIFVEAKPLKADISKHIEQAVRYGYNRKGVPFVMLTDFEGIKLFDVTIKPDIRNPSTGLKLNLFWNFYESQFDTLWQLSKESVINGELDKLLLKKPKDRIPVDKAILDDLKEWREALAKDIYKNNPHLFLTNTDVSLRRSEATEAISISSKHEIATPSARNDNMGRDADYLKEITQRILDRIIFMRSCEDRGLIHRTPLKVFFEEHTDTLGTNTMVFLKEEFKHYNIIFDSDLFSPKDWEKDLQIDFRVMNKIVMDTYNPYQFDVIPLEVLGNIYEQYLGYTIRLTPQQVKYELKPEVRKAGGVYYTPEYIVDYIVKNTVGKILQDSTPNPSLSLRGAKRRGNLSSKKIKKLRILDPACGSGSFLIRAYEEMLNYYKEQKKKQKPQMNTDKYNSSSLSLREAERRGNLTQDPIQKELDLKHEDTEPRLTIEEKSQILKNHIFGIDIDEQAVEVTKLSLMLKMLEGEFGIIPGRNILPMLDKNIRCGNSLISGSPLELKKYFGEDWYKVKPFNWDEEFKEIMKEGGFDVVIGNPPYVRSESLNKLHRDYFSTNFVSATGQFDIYVLFLEKGIDLLKQHGYFGFIISNKFFISDYGIGIRKKITKDMKIEQVIDVSYLPVFRGISVYPVIFIQSKNKFTHGTIKVANRISSEDYLIKGDIPFEYINVDEVILNHEKGFDFSTAGIDRKIIRKIEKDKRLLVDLCKTSRGFRPPPSKLTIVRRDKEKSLAGYEKFIIGKDLKGPYSMNWSGSLVKYIPKEIPESKPIEVFKGPKICIRDIGLAFNAYLDYEGLLCLKTIYFLYNFININPKYLISLLNSKLMNYYFKNKFSTMHIGGGYLRFRKQYLDQLPVYTINFSKISEKKFHDELVALVDVMLDLNKKIQSAKGSAKEQIQKQIDATDQQIDNLVYKLYNITEDERKIIERN